MFLNNKNEICVALSILEACGAVSGLKLNMDKCEGFWLGKNNKSQKNCTLFGIKWPNQFRYLGIYLGYNVHLNEMKNWHEKIDAIESTLHAWEKRDLTLFGRVQIFENFCNFKINLASHNHIYS